MYLQSRENKKIVKQFQKVSENSAAHPASLTFVLCIFAIELRQLFEGALNPNFLNLTINSEKVWL